jgi:hypothetical protein
MLVMMRREKSEVIPSSWVTGMVEALIKRGDPRRVVELRT